MRHPIYVIGGGIIGLLCARDLVLNGVNVILLERGALGKESSWAGGGIISALYPWLYPESVNILVNRSQKVYPELVSQLFESTGIDSELINSGLLILDEKNSENAGILAEITKYGFVPVDRNTLDKLEPSLSKEPKKGLWRDDIAQIRNPRLLASLRKDLIAHGVKIRENTEVSGFISSQVRLSAIQTNRGKLTAERCIVTAGAWTAGLLESTGLQLPIRPVRGQMLLLRSRPGLIKRILLRDYHYLIPRQDGHVLVGSSFEEAGFDKSTTARVREELLHVATTLVPALAASPIEQHWAGLRPGSPEGVPYIGEHPVISGLYICAGHFRNGFAQGPASASLVVDLVMGRKPNINPEPYSLSSR